VLVHVLPVADVPVPFPRRKQHVRVWVVERHQHARSLRRRRDWSKTSWETFRRFFIVVEKKEEREQKSAMGKTRKHATKEKTESHIEAFLGRASLSKLWRLLAQERQMPPPARPK
jgi:hypothetical protein